jgi:hypothetical protein
LSIWLTRAKWLGSTCSGNKFPCWLYLLSFIQRSVFFNFVFWNVFSFISPGDLRDLFALDTDIISETSDIFAEVDGEITQRDVDFERTQTPRRLQELDRVRRDVRRQLSRQEERLKKRKAISSSDRYKSSSSANVEMETEEKTSVDGTGRL